MSELNVFMGTERPIEVGINKRVRRINVMPKSIEPQHLQSSTYIVKAGLAADLPTDGSVYPFYFAKDTGVFYGWNGTAWLQTTLT